MSVALIIQIIQTLSAVVQQGYSLYNDAESTLSLQDAQQIKLALQQAQQATNNLRSVVDAALDAASKT